MARRAHAVSFVLLAFVAVSAVQFVVLKPTAPRSLIDEAPYRPPWPGADETDAAVPLSPMADGRGAAPAMPVQPSNTPSAAPDLLQLNPPVSPAAGDNARQGPTSMQLSAEARNTPRPEQQAARGAQPPHVVGVPAPLPVAARQMEKYIISLHLEDAVEVRASSPERRRATTVLIFSPHLDDAVFSMGAFLSRQRAVRIVTVFAGLPSDPNMSTIWDQWSGFPNASEALRVRKLEDSNAALRLADGGTLVPEMVHWGFLDLQYRHNGESVEQRQNLTSNIQLKMEKEIRAARKQLAMSALRGKKLHVYGPWWYKNPDHCDVRSAFLKIATRMWSLPDVVFHIYEDLPYSARLTSNWTSEVNFTLQQAVSPLRCYFKEHRVSISEEQMQTKLYAIAMYDTQVSMFPNITITVDDHTRRRCAPQQDLCEVSWQLISCNSTGSTR